MSIRAAEFDALLRRRRRMLTGVALDTRIIEVATAVTTVERVARHLQRSFLRSPRRHVLWSDLAHLTPFSNAISSQYLNLRSMALAWAVGGHGLSGSKALLHDIVSGLEWLKANEFNARTAETGNWYDYEIGAPRCLTDILVLLGRHVTPEQRRRYLKPVVKFDGNPDVMANRPGGPAPTTGANRTDKAMVDLYEGLLLHDGRAIGRAVRAIRSVLPEVTRGDGFYADGSFVFHEFFPYSGNYGVVLLSDVADALYLLHESRWDLGRRVSAVMCRRVRDAFSPLVYRGAMMDMVRGRLISFQSAPSHAVGHRVIAAVLRLAQTATTPDAAMLRAASKRWCEDDTSRSYADSLPLDLIAHARRLLRSTSLTPAPPLVCSQLFASMDRAVHHRPTFAVGIAMHSTRIQNYESINGNDLDGWHTSDGMVYLYDADLLQFDGSFWPTVDSERLPGTTVMARSRPPEGRFGGSSAVGGASLDGYSAVMMQLNVFQGRLQAKKSWFLFDREVVALGADINCTVPRRAVTTVVENRKLASPRAKRLRRASSWANLPGTGNAPPIGYVFPSDAAFRSRRHRRRGSWRDVDDGSASRKLSASYQTIWIEHGTTPRRAEYVYVLLPGADADATRAYAADPDVQILRNRADAQAVTCPTLGITAVNFWRPGVTVAGITTDAVCSVLVRRADGRLTVAVSDPTQDCRKLRVTIFEPVIGARAVDRGIEVRALHPVLTLAVNVAGAAGRTFRAVFTLAE